MIAHLTAHNEDFEEYLFDLCVTIWEKINNRPSVRWHAFNTIVGIAKRHPCLDTLSPGIKNSIDRIIKEYSE